MVCREVWKLREFNAQNWPTGLKPMSLIVRASMKLLASRLWFLLERNRRCVEPMIVLVKLVCVFMAVFLEGLEVCAVLM